MLSLVPTILSACKLSCMLFCGRCNTSAFRSSSTDWKKKAASDAHTLSEYAKLFGADEATPAAEEMTDVGDENAMIEDTNMTAAAAAPAAADATTGKQGKKMKKDKQGGNADQAELLATAEATPAAAAAITGKPKKKRKKDKQSGNADQAELLATAGAAPEDAVDVLEGCRTDKLADAQASQQLNLSKKLSKKLRTDNAMALLGFAAGQQKPYPKKVTRKNKASTAE